MTVFVGFLIDRFVLCNELERVDNIKIKCYEGDSIQSF